MRIEEMARGGYLASAHAPGFGGAVEGPTVHLALTRLVRMLDDILTEKRHT